MDPIEYYEDKLAHEMDAWDLSETLRRGERVVVLDVRSPQAFEAEHIPGALNVPHRSMNPETTSQFDRETLYVTYCDGIGCNGSSKGALNMARLGFKVKELVGGMDWWRRDGHPAEAGGASAKSP